MTILGYTFSSNSIRAGFYKGGALAALICATIFVQLQITNPQVIPELRLSTWLLAPVNFILIYILRESRSDSADELFATTDEVVRTLAEVTIAVLSTLMIVAILRAAGL